MQSEDIAYIAGFFDGEGHARIAMVKSGKYGKRYPRLLAKVSQNDRCVLEWIADQFGFGKIYAKRDERTINTNHELQLTHRQARIFLSTIEPYLKVKKILVSNLLDQTNREY